METRFRLRVPNRWVTIVENSEVSSKVASLKSALLEEDSSVILGFLVVAGTPWMGLSRDLRLLWLHLPLLGLL